MNRCKWWLCGLGVLLVVFSPVMSQQKDPKAEKPKRPKTEGRERAGRQRSPERSLYAVMVRELKLTDKQKTKLKVILKVHKDKADAWTKENGEKLKGLRNERQEARKAGNKEKTRTLNKQLKPLEDARKKLELEKMAAVTVILTPEQKKAWKAYQFHSGVVRRYRRMRLKDEQKKQIRELCAAAQKEIEALGDKKKGRKKILDDLNKKIVAEVLTEEQRAQRKRVRTRGQRGGDRPRAAGQERPRKQ